MLPLFWETEVMSRSQRTGQTAVPNLAKKHLINSSGQNGQIFEDMLAHSWILKCVRVHKLIKYFLNIYLLNIHLIQWMLLIVF